MIALEPQEHFFNAQNRSLNILYVEDDEKIQNQVFKMLSRKYENIFVASNGEEGVALYETHTPDIIITDIKMPKMNGLEMIQKIREKNKNVPIIITTAHSDSSFLHQALELGVDAFLVKPINKEELFTRVDSCAKQVNFTLMGELFLATAKSMKKGLLVQDKANKTLYSNTLYQEHLSSTEMSLSKDDYSRLENGEPIIQTIEIDKRFIELSVTPVLNNAGRVSFFLFTSEDVTPRQNHLLLLEKEAYVDALTGIYRRSFFENKFEQIEKNAQSIYMALLDIDHFKRVNDTFGHATGDEVLRQFSSTVKASLRNNELLFRWGGEEFVLLLVNVNKTEASQICERILKSVEQHDFKIEHKVTTSIGLAKHTLHYGYEQTLKNADKALYIAKNSGRNRLEVFE
jgi:two-component system cell cycle response regulator